MIAATIAWLSQDIFQVVAMGFMLAPEFFLLMLLYGLVSGPLLPHRVAGWVWFAFFGGVLWDLRWATTPGMSALINIAAVALVYWVWNRTPVGGRGALLFAALAGSAIFMSGMAHYFAWSVPSRAAMRLFLIQQLITVPFLIALGTLYAYKARKTNV